MDDDFRVTVDVEEGGAIAHLLESVREHRVARQARSRLGERVVITVDAPRMFAYTADEASAHEAARVLTDLARSQHLTATATIHRWHPVEEAWEPVDAPLPQTEEERQAEEERLAARETEETREADVYQWEVRVELPTQEAAIALAERLEAERLDLVRRSTFVVVGAVSEEAGEELAERLRGEVPDAKIVVEGSAAEAWDETHPFRILRGLGGLGG